MINPNKKIIEPNQIDDICDRINKSIEDKFKVLQSSLQETITKEIDILKSNIQAVEKSFDNKINNIETEINDMMNRIDIIEHNNDNLTDKMNKIDLGKDIENVEFIKTEIFEEIRERSIRDKNVIIHGIEEIDDASDKLSVKQLFKDAKFNEDDYRIHRIGKKTNHNTKKRPIKAIFNITHHAKWVKFHSKEFCPPEVRCVNDETLKERNYMKDIIAELNRRKNSGEEDIIIKYINNNPTIIKKYPKLWKSSLF